MRTNAYGSQLALGLEVGYVSAIGYTKIAILLFYRRLTTDVSRGLRWINQAGIAFICAYMITFTLTTIFGCRPIAAAWKQVELVYHFADYHCLREGLMIEVSAAFGVLQDFIMCSLPMMVFWTMRMPLAQKFLLAALFGIGYLYVNVHFRFRFPFSFPLSASYAV